DTSSVSGTNGFLDFQFNPGGIAQGATAQMTGFATTGGSLIGFPSISGNVTGTLPGNVTFVNSAALNEYFQDFKFGTNFSFVVTLSGPAVDAPDASTIGSTFSISLYDGMQQPILTNQG